jgi:hypothetical protein
MEPDERDDARQAWESEYDQWCAEQDDADEINRMLNEANNADE